MMDLFDSPASRNSRSTCLDSTAFNVQITTTVSHASSSLTIAFTQSSPGPMSLRAIQQSKAAFFISA